MTVREIYEYFERLFKKETAAAWDSDGLCCCPDETRRVRRVLVALDPTAGAVERATAGGFDLLLTHHPLLFRPLAALTGERTVPAKLLKLARAGVAALAYHTRLDAAKGGVNDILADLLGVPDAVPFGPEGEIPCGRIGTLAAPVTAEEFAKLVKERLHAPVVRLAGGGTVQKIALCGGEGGDFVEAARAAGADLFLSGRVGYHRMLDGAEEGLSLIEAGHYATEFPVTAYLAELVRRADPAIETEIYKTDVIRAV